MGQRFSLCDQVFLSETRKVEVLQILHTESFLDIKLPRGPASRRGSGWNVS